MRAVPGLQIASPAQLGSPAGQPRLYRRRDPDHAHIDHSGYLPLLVKNGFKGKVFCSQATYELCRILLPDSGHLQEEEANYANRKGSSKHKPALPLYTREDAQRCIGHFSPQRFGADWAPVEGLTADLTPSGHMLGSAFVRLRDERRSVLFSGDIGRPNDLVLAAPYLGYMRQDTRFHPGEAITSRTYASLLSRAVDGLVTVDPHLHRYRALSDIYAVPAVAVRSAPQVGQWVQGNVSRPLLIGPDSESEQWVAEAAAHAGAPWTVLKKTRHGDRDVDVGLPDASAWLDRNPVLIDDIVSSAATMIAAAQSLHKAGFAAPTCLAVHALFSAGSWEKLRASGVSRVVSCDTVSHPSNAIVTLEPMALALRELIDQL